MARRRVEKISVAVRHYFGQYEEAKRGRLRVAAESAEEVGLSSKTPEEILAAEAGRGREAEEVSDISSEEIAAAQDEASDALSDAGRTGRTD